MSSEFQAEGKDGAIEPSGVVESPEWRIIPKYLVGRALHNRVSGAEDHSEARFKDSAESETSRIRLGPLRDESKSRVGRLNSEETDSAENRS